MWCLVQCGFWWHCSLEYLDSTKVDSWNIVQLALTGVSTTISLLLSILIGKLEFAPDHSFHFCMSSYTSSTVLFPRNMLMSSAVATEWFVGKQHILHHLFTKLACNIVILRLWTGVLLAILPAITEKVLPLPHPSTVAKPRKKERKNRKVKQCTAVWRPLEVGSFVDSTNN